ncbi:MAG: hypothetical protein IPL19_32405 [Sandaracinaceae bacterium]|nr:hypothetical protein [Sandaracinaceae bacterium]
MRRTDVSQGGYGGVGLVKDPADVPRVLAEAKEHARTGVLCASTRISATDFRKG